jgi:Uma2 family endonuclease
MEERSKQFSPTNPGKMSIEEYFQLENSSLETRYEYVDGEVRMLAGGTLDHGIIRLNLASILRNLLNGRPCRVFSEDRVRVSASKYVYPDVTVSCSQQDRGKATSIQHPLLVVEVLSPGTEDYDRGRKYTYYRDCTSIREYMLINTQYPSIELYRRESKHLWTIYTYPYEATVELVSLNMSFPVAEVYKKTSLSPDEDEQADFSPDDEEEPI